jgi:hypothetical protein
MVVHAARAAMETEGSKPTYQPNGSSHAESKLITCLSQICRGAGVIHKNKICYNFGAAAFHLSYILDVRPTFVKDPSKTPLTPFVLKGHGSLPDDQESWLRNMSQ